MKVLPYIALAVALTIAACVRSSPEDTHVAVLSATIEALEECVSALSEMRATAEPGLVSKTLHGPSALLLSASRRWQSLERPTSDQSGLLVGLHGKRVLQVAEALLVQQMRFESVKTRAAVHDSTACWLFENQNVIAFAEKLFTAEVTTGQVQGMLRNSGRVGWVDGSGRMINRFLDAGLVIAFVDGHVSEINDSPVSTTHRQELMRLIGPGGVFAEDEGIREVYERLAEEEKGGDSHPSRNSTTPSSSR